MELEKFKGLPNLAKAVIKVINAVEGIDKTMTVGEGRSAYNAVSDKEVKQLVGKQMALNGLCILPISINPTLKIDRWEENTDYGKKQKQSVFTEIKSKYLLLHESGESIVLSGYGHGIDSQDKSAGKATTYALKYLLLYTFLVPTGKIADADNPTKNKEVVTSHDSIVKTLASKSTEAEITAYFKTLSETEKTNKAIIALFAKRKTELNG